MHCFLIDFSIISHLSHFVDTSCESSTVKSHRYWVNEIAMWDERSEISVKHQWRCRMSHSTSRQCILVFIATLRRKVLASQCIFQSILDTCCHIDATSHEKRNQNVEALKISMSSSYKSILFFVESCRIIEDQFVRFCSFRISVWSSSSEFTQQWQSLTSFNRLRIYRIEEACIEASELVVGGACIKASESTSLMKLQNSSLRKLQNSSLRELARKLQTLHRWESFRTRRWESLHDSFELIRISALDRTHRRMLWRSVEKYNLHRKMIKNSVDRNWRKKN